MSNHEIHALNCFAIESLDKMWCRKQLLFTQSYNPNIKYNEDYVLKTNNRYTAMSLIGLKKARDNGYKMDIPLENIAKNYFSLINKMDAENLGLIMWLNSIYHIIPDLELFQSTRNKQDFFFSKYAKVMNLGWLLTGLTLTYEKEKNQDIKNLAIKIFKQLLLHQNKNTGLFRTTKFAISRQLLHNIREFKLGSFAAQIYPLLALAEYYRVFKDERALKSALSCANTLVNLQGSEGQWWWIYHVDRGKVTEGYPVYSVHQDGMAPMALFKLQEVSDVNFEKAIYLGLDWIYGNNELNSNMFDEKNKIIWRAIQRKEPGRQYSFGMGLSGHLNSTFGALFSNLTLRKIFNKIYPFEILNECRSYHLGWILNAFADK